MRGVLKNRSKADSKFGHVATGATKGWVVPRKPGGNAPHTGSNYHIDAPGPATLNSLIILEDGRVYRRFDSVGGDYQGFAVVESEGVASSDKSIDIKQQTHILAYLRELIEQQNSENSQ